MDKTDKKDKSAKTLEIEARQSYAHALLEQGVNTTTTATMVSARFKSAAKPLYGMWLQPATRSRHQTMVQPAMNP